MNFNQKNILIIYFLLGFGIILFLCINSNKKKELFENQFNNNLIDNNIKERKISGDMSIKLAEKLDIAFPGYPAFLYSDMYLDYSLYNCETNKKYAGRYRTRASCQTDTVSPVPDEILKRMSKKYPRQL
jgi:hypothetical protein